MNNAEQNNDDITAETTVHFQPEIVPHSAVSQPANTKITQQGCSSPCSTDFTKKENEIILREYIVLLDLLTVLTKMAVVMERKSSLTVLPVTKAITRTCTRLHFAFCCYLFSACLNLTSPTLSPHTSSTPNYWSCMFHVTAKKFGVNVFDCFVTQGRAVTHIHPNRRRRRVCPPNW